MSLGRGAVIILLRKQKLNVITSNEGKIIGADDEAGTIIWGKRFIKAQEYMVEHNMLYQYNKSTIYWIIVVVCSVQKNPRTFNHDIPSSKIE